MNHIGDIGDIGDIVDINKNILKLENNIKNSKDDLSIEDALFKYIDYMNKLEYYKKYPKTKDDYYACTNYMENCHDIIYIPDFYKWGKKEIYNCKLNKIAINYKRLVDVHNILAEQNKKYE